MKLWKVYTPEGEYLGEAAAFSPEAAFRDYLAIVGKTVGKTDVTCQPIGGGMQKVIFESKEYFLVPEE